ncbi:sensor histidine kinase [Nonomuraea sp. SBT364]|uniref:sensor histidine kinase n=1 Tax=Nonomuraea sp. SBT364 TaxID=1580530 RepID=UPI001E28DDDB|nr:histidine kinase [Nonomuraea sp. SBT364]
MRRSVWDEPRPVDPPRRVWRDWVLVGVLAPVALLEGLLRPDLQWRAVSVVVTIGLVLTLLWRRTRPLLMLVIAFGVTGLAPLVVGGDPSLYTMACLLLLPYALVRWGSGREAAAGLVVMLVSIGFSTVPARTPVADAVGAFSLMLAAVALGVAFRYRAVVRVRELDRVKLLERERLARDLHDTVAHHVSAMAIRAQAGLATGTPDAAAESLRVIEAEASRTLQEMRAMVRVLRRDESGEAQPTGHLADLERLAGDVRSGARVEVELMGDLDDLHPSTTAAIYRIAQESVTNARRHARNASRITIRVTGENTSVRLWVNDDGDAGPAATPGYGLLGMMERAELLGGGFQAGPGEGGWTVSAVLPRTGAAT